MIEHQKWIVFYENNDFEPTTYDIFSAQLQHQTVFEVVEWIISTLLIQQMKMKLRFVLKKTIQNIIK